MNILVVDDHPMVLQGIGAALSARGHQVGLARTLEQACSLLRSPVYDLLLLDYNLAEASGADLLQAGGVTLPPCVIVLSGMTDPEDILSALELGATAFLPKSVELEQMLLAVEEGPGLDRSGHIWDMQRGGYQPASEAFPRGTVLSPKEREVFMQLRRGLLDKQIADQLSLSIHTVRVHIRAIKRKRGNPRRQEKSV